MSDSSVIFKRTKSKSTPRARLKSPDANDTGSEQTSQAESPITLASKLKNKAKRAKPKSRLSFGGDDDSEVCVLTGLRDLVLMIVGMEGGGEVFQVKKSNLSQKLRLGSQSGSTCVFPFHLQCLVADVIPRTPPASLDQANISHGAPSYSAEYLSELKASTPSSRRPQNYDPYDADMSMDTTADFSIQTSDSLDLSSMFLGLFPCYIG